MIPFTLGGAVLLFDKARHQVGKLQEIGNPDHCATLADDDLWVGSDDVGPMPRN